jgi:6-pyruvoyl-tetrahydropterin synthase
MQNTLLNINPEGNLLKEIKDILDELHILTRVKLQQQAIAESFVKHIKQSLLPQLQTKRVWDPIMALYGDGHDANSEILQNEQRQAARWTVARADHLLNDIQDRIGELKTLEENARKTAASVSSRLSVVRIYCVSNGTGI